MAIVTRYYAFVMLTYGSRCVRDNASLTRRLFANYRRKRECRYALRPKTEICVTFRRDVSD